MPSQVSVQELFEYLQAGNPVYLIDVREEWERDLAKLPDHLHVPLGELEARAGDVRPPEGAMVVAYCHQGVRSLHAAQFLEQARGIRVQSLAGGISAWSRQVDPSIPTY